MSSRKLLGTDQGQKTLSHVRYPASLLARWLDLQKTHQVIATQLVYWCACCCLATSYNVRPIVACAYREVFIEPLPSNDLSISVTILSLVTVTIDGVWNGDWIY
jgi:hypothetical protein